MTKQPQQLGHIQALRGVAALMVVGFHLLAIENKYSTDRLLPELFYIGYAGVDLFFVISGFIMVYISQIRPQMTPAPARAFLFARVTRIYPLYWLVSLAVLILYLWRPSMVFASSPEPPHLIKSFLLWPDTTLPLLQLGWTLIHEMGFYLIFTVSLFLKKEHLPFFLLAWLVALICGQYFELHTTGPVMAVLFSPFSYEFLAGAFTALFLTQIKSLPQTTQAYGGLAFLAIALLVYALTLPPNELPVLKRVLTFAPIATLTLLTAGCLDFRQVKAPDFLVTLGDASYALYLTHILTLSLLGRVWAPYAIESTLMDNALVLLLMTGASICVAHFTYRLIEAPLMRLSHMWRTRLFP